MRASLTVGDIEVELLTDPGPLEAALVHAYAAFLGRPSAQPTYTLRLQLQPGGVDVIDEPSLLAGEPGVFLPGASSGADFASYGSLVCTVAGLLSTDRAVRTLVAGLALRSDGLLIAGSAVMGQGGAHLFVGPSGSGKSTMIGLAGDRPVLADGYVLVQRVGGTWVAASSPFGGPDRAQVPRQAPLKGVWGLRHWPVNDRFLLDRAAAAELTARHAVVPGPGFATAAADLTRKLASAMPSSVLGFVPTPKVWEVVDSR
jgi:hypothetical protein